MEPTSQDDRRATLARKVLAALGAASLDVATGGAVGALAGAAAAPILEHLSSYDRRAGENAAVVACHAAVLADLSPEQLGAWAAADDRRLSLLASVIQGVWRTLDERKLAAFAALLADAARDDTLIDTNWLLCAALADIEWPHVRVLKALRDDPSPLGVGSSRNNEQGGVVNIWSMQDFTIHFPSLATGIDSIVATLRRHGLIEEEPSIGNRMHATISAFGRAFLQLIENSTPLQWAPETDL